MSLWITLNRHSVAEAVINIGYSTLYEGERKASTSNTMVDLTVE